MPRAKDLDTVAPDDVVISKPVEKPIVKSVTKTPDKNNITDPKTNIPTTDDGFPQEIYNILGHTKSPFSSFLVHPKVLTFSERDDNEKIYLAVRPHWVTNLSWIFTSILMLAVPLFFKYFSFLNFFPVQYQFATVLFWYLITFIYAFEKFLSWYFNLFLVTNQRVVDIDFNNMLNKHFAEADLSVIQDVSSSVRGVMGTFFNYGDVLIQTAAEINQIIFEKVPNPEKILKLLKELRDIEEQKDHGGAK